MANDEKTRKCNVEGCGGTMKPFRWGSSGLESVSETMLFEPYSPVAWVCDDNAEHAERILRVSK